MENRATAGMLVALGGMLASAWQDPNEERRAARLKIVEACAKATARTVTPEELVEGAKSVCGERAAPEAVQITVNLDEAFQAHGVRPTPQLADLITCVVGQVLEQLPGTTEVRRAVVSPGALNN